ncbi:6299_t:CDS:2 [Funneliformis geosporum]|uniref:1828_t:CDS:1 n=1 Tax=Funneliformis geosporum TaxID=1117311 RepID=A0A9W4SXI2_9GLOM|nr:6299_t:CDS:2 [Funneliformis geosporum]CAI2182666.1 1828_t:CDS:2 [Funneliformis geosporum]
MLLTKVQKNSLQFVWQEFGKDFTFTICNAEVHKIFPIHFSYQNQTKKKQTLICSLKRKSEELEKICDNEESSIIHRISLEVNGKNITPESTQTLMVIHEEKKVALYNINHNIKKLKDKVTQLHNEKSNLNDKTDLNQRFEKIKKAVHDILNEKIWDLQS